MKKLGNRFLAMMRLKNPSLKCQIFKTFPFPGERNKDKYLPLKEVHNFALSQGAQKLPAVKLQMFTFYTIP